MREDWLSQVTRNTLAYMSEGLGHIPARIYFALGSKPLAYRTFGNNAQRGELNRESIENKFGGNYLITMITAGVSNRFLHAEGTTQTLYVDRLIYDFFQAHGILDCGVWDNVDGDTLEESITFTNCDARWAYSACKPYATLAEISRAIGEAERRPLLFHDTDLILHKAYDRLLKLRGPEDVKIGFGHLEAVGKTAFYPSFNRLHFPKGLILSNDGHFLINKRTGHSYRTDLPAVNTCLMYFSDLGAAQEWAELFRDMMMDNWIEDLTWLKGEQNLLADDQRSCLMVSERRGLKFMEEVVPMIPLLWEGEGFADAATGAPARMQWHYYRPDYVDPEEHPEAKDWFQDVQHLWNQKSDIERYQAYANYLGMMDLELIRVLCPRVGLSWKQLECSLRSFVSLHPYFALLDTGKSIEALLSEEKRKPVAEREIDDVLIKNLKRPLVSPASQSNYAYAKENV